MAFLDYNLGWTFQPPGRPGVSRHPRTEGLVLFAPLSGAYQTLDLVQNQVGTATGLSAYVPSQADTQYPLFGTSNFVDFPELPALTATTPTTIAWTQEPRSPSGYSCLLNVKVAGATYPFAIYQSASDSNYYFVVGPRVADLGVTKATFSANVGPTTDQRLDRFVLWLPNGMANASTARLWRNGIEIAAGTSSATNDFGTNTTASFRVGALETGSDPFEGLIGDMCFWARLLPEGDAEAESTIQGSWVLYAPQTVWFPDFSTGTTVALSGASATSSAGILLPSTAIALAGSPATASAGTITPSVGTSATLTGSAATTSAGTFGVSLSKALSGQASTVSAGTLIPGYSFALTGSSATTAAGSIIPSIAIGLVGISVAASAGTISASGGSGGSAALSGVQATIGIGVLGVTITLPLSGSAASMALGTLSPSTGTAVITIEAGSWIRYRKIP